MGGQAGPAWATGLTSEGGAPSCHPHRNPSPHPRPRSYADVCIAPASNHRGLALSRALRGAAAGAQAAVYDLQTPVYDPCEHRREGRVFWCSGIRAGL